MERAGVEDEGAKNLPPREASLTARAPKIAEFTGGVWRRRIQLAAAIVMPSLGFLLYLTWIDLPCFREHYLHVDTVRNWFDPPGSDFFRKYYHGTLCDQGRPLAAYLQIFYWSLAPTVAGLHLLRFLGACHLAVGGGIFFAILRRSSIPALHAAALTCAIISLPGYQFMVLSAAGVAMVLALVLVMFAALICQHKEHWFSGPRYLWDFFPAVAVFALLIISLFIYQSFTMVFWATLAIPILFAARGNKFCWKDRVLIPFVICAVAMGLYFVYIRSVPHVLPVQVDPSHDTHLLVGDLAGKLAWFGGAVLPVAFNLWRLQYSVVFASIAILIAITGSLLRWKRSAMLWNPDGRWRRILDASCCEAALATLLLLTFSPNIISSGKVIVTRTMTGLHAAIILVLYAAIMEICSFIPHVRLRETAARGVLAGTLLYGTIVAACNAQDFVRRDGTEFIFIKSLLAEPNFAQVRAIHFIYQPNPVPGADEYGETSSMAGGHGVGVIRAAMYELGMADRVATTPITYGTESVRTGVYNTPNGPVLVINLDVLSRQLFQNP